MDVEAKLERLGAVSDDMVGRVLGLEFLVASLFRNRFQDIAMAEREAIVIAAAQAAHDTILNHPGLPDDIRAQLAVNVGTAVGNVCKDAAGPGPYQDLLSMALN